VRICLHRSESQATFPGTITFTSLGLEDVGFPQGLLT
jgi:hypothetical protein